MNKHELRTYCSKYSRWQNVVWVLFDTKTECLWNVAIIRVNTALEGETEWQFNSESYIILWTK